MSPDFNIDEDLALANRLADAAWSAIRPHFRALSSVENKAGAGQSYDPVTEADRAAEKAMRDIILRERPQLLCRFFLPLFGQCSVLLRPAAKILFYLPRSCPVP